jgi:hypothetical protein
MCLSKDGLLLLPAEYVLDEHVIERLQIFSEPFDHKMNVRIYTNRRK